MTPEPKNGPYRPCSCYNHQKLFCWPVWFGRATVGPKWMAVGSHMTCNRGYIWVIFGGVTQQHLKVRVNGSGDTAVSNRGTDSGVGLDHVGGTALQELMHSPCTTGQVCRRVKNIFTPEPKNSPYCPCSCYSCQKPFFVSMLPS